MKRKTYICDEIDNLILKYGIDRHYPRYRKNIRAKSVLYEVFDRLPTGDSVVLVGVHKEEMEYVGECISNKQRRIQKVQWNGTQEQIKGLLDENTVVYLVSFVGRDKMRKTLQDAHVRYTDIYEVFGKINIVFEDEFYRILSNDKSHMAWDNDIDYKWDELYQMEYCENLRRYREAHISYKKCIYAERMAFLALWVRDFDLFVECAELAKAEQSDIDFDGLADEINTYLKECEKKIKNRDTEDIITFWIDAIPYGETDNMIFWNEIKRKANSFTRAYAVTPNTKPVFRSMFCQCKEITDKGYKIREVNETNSSLIKILKTNEFEIKTISGYFGDVAKKTEIKKTFGFRTPASMILWQMLMQLMESGKRQFIICHIFAETHYPYISMGDEGYDMCESVRRIYGERKTDRLLKYYSKFIPSKATCIYMSDHGKGGHVKTHHINFDIISEKLGSEKREDLISTLDFSNIIDEIIKGKSEIRIDSKRKSVPVEVLDYYSKKSTMRLFAERILLEPYQFGYVGDIYKDHLGLCFSTGMKWAISMEQHLESCPNSYEMRQILGVSEDVLESIPDFPYEVMKDEKFIYAGFQHQLYERYLQRITERLRKIENTLANYQDGEVAIRTGGFHSLKLYEMLSTTAKRKIRFFIDDKDSCLCNREGMSVLSIKEFIEKGREQCKAVILSSYDHIEELRGEVTEGLYDGFDIIDIYRIFAEKGIECMSDFYIALYDSDYRDAINNVCKVKVE